MMVRLSGPSSPGIELGEAKQITAFHSSSSPGTFHFTMELSEPAVFKRFGGEVTILCTCKGFFNHRKCWHVAAVAGDDLDDEGVGE